MGNSPLPSQNQYAWLFKNGRWIKICNPIHKKNGSIMDDEYERYTWRKILYPYNLRWWSLGPAFSSSYSGLVITSYISLKRDGKRPQFLLLLARARWTSVVYAHSLPDAFSVFVMLAPLVTVDVFVEIYRGILLYSHKL